MEKSYTPTNLVASNGKRKPETWRLAIQTGQMLHTPSHSFLGCKYLLILIIFMRLGKDQLKIFAFLFDRVETSEDYGNIWLIKIIGNRDSMYFTWLKT